MACSRSVDGASAPSLVERPASATRPYQPPAPLTGPRPRPCLGVRHRVDGRSLSAGEAAAVTRHEPQPGSPRCLPRGPAQAQLAWAGNRRPDGGEPFSDVVEGTDEPVGSAGVQRGEHEVAVGERAPVAAGDRFEAEVVERPAQASGRKAASPPPAFTAPLPQGRLGGSERCLVAWRRRRRRRGWWRRWRGCVHRRLGTGR